MHRIVRKLKIPFPKSISQIRKTKIMKNIPLVIGITFTSLYCINSAKSYEDEELKKVKTQLIIQQKRLKGQFGDMTVYPQIKYNLRGNLYSIQFQIDQRKCNMFNLVSQFLSLYTNSKDFKIVDFKVLQNNGVLTWSIDFLQNDPKWKTPQKGKLTITGVKTNQRPNFRFIFQKDDFITQKNLNGLKTSYKEVIRPKSIEAKNSFQQRKTRTSTNTKQKTTVQKASEIYQQLQKFGATVFDPHDKTIDLDWDYLAGYQKQKRAIQDTVLLALNYPQIYDQITKQTRVKYEPNRPKAVLFQGPPGTGKTTSAKIIAQQVNIPLIYMPTQAILSKFYGQSQQKLSSLWQICKKLGKVIIFIDQIDALAGNRSTDMHQASRRVLSTLLRKIDSFQSTLDVLLICATNRKQDLDPAMLSRIDLSINFILPDKQSRAAIFSKYAKHLNQNQRIRLAQSTEGFSGRNISDVCKDAQRKWASKLIRKQVNQSLPNLDQYISASIQRKINDLG